MHIRLLFLFVGGLVMGENATAQMLPQLSPVTQNRPLERENLATSAPKAAVQLPFFDDFSYESSRPNANLWLDRQVFVNRTLAGDKTPSIGVATFDGLNERGNPYAPFAVPQTRGGLDTLTSQTIDLTGLTPADSLIFSFWVQPKGLTYAPFEQDSFIVEFRNAVGSWEKINSLSQRGLSNTSPFNQLEYLPEFGFLRYKIVDARFMHANFQFRFRTLGRRQGNYETWHLDYVHLNRNRTSVATFSDLAFMAQPRFALKKYSRKPWKHVVASNYADLRDSFSVSIRNHFERDVNTSSSSIRSQELVTNTNLTTTNTGFTGVIRRNTAFVDTFRRPNTLLPNYESNLRNNYAGRDSLIVETTYSFVSGEAKPTNPNYIGATTNNSVKRRTIMDNEFAYDDGTAEAVLTGSPVDGYTLALKMTANTSDTIRAVRFQFPNLKTNAALSSFRILIWQDTLLDPDNTRSPKLIYVSPDTLSPIYPDRIVDTLQGLTTYVLIDSLKRPRGVSLKAGNFYVGWQTIGATQIPVGFDRNNNEIYNNEVRYLDETRTWRTFPAFGAPIVRVVTGRWTPNPTSPLIASTKENTLLTAQSFSIYPNPTSERLTIEVKNVELQQKKLEYSLFDLSGRLVKTHRSASLLGGGISTLDCTDLNAGLYILKIENTENRQSLFQKVSIIR